MTRVQILEDQKAIFVAQKEELGKEEELEVVVTDGPASLMTGVEVVDFASSGGFVLDVLEEA